MSTTTWLRAIGRFELPNGWSLASVGSRYEVQLGKMLNADRAAEPGEPGAAPYLRNVNVQWDRIDTAELNWMRFSAEDRTKYALRRGDLWSARAVKSGAVPSGTQHATIASSRRR